MLLRSDPWITLDALVGRADGRQGGSCFPGAPTATLTVKAAGHERCWVAWVHGRAT